MNTFERMDAINPEVYREAVERVEELVDEARVAHRRWWFVRELNPVTDAFVRTYSQSFIQRNKNYDDMERLISPHVNILASKTAERLQTIRHLLEQKPDEVSVSDCILLLFVDLLSKTNAVEDLIVLVLEGVQFVSKSASFRQHLNGNQVSANHVGAHTELQIDAFLLNAWNPLSMRYIFDIVFEERDRGLFSNRYHREAMHEHSENFAYPYRVLNWRIYGSRLTIASLTMLMESENVPFLRIMGGCHIENEDHEIVPADFQSVFLRELAIHAGTLRNWSVSCPKLEHLKVIQHSDGITEQTFAMCPSLRSVVFAESHLPFISDRAFFLCPNIESLTLQERGVLDMFPLFWNSDPANRNELSTLFRIPCNTEEPHRMHVNASDSRVLYGRFFDLVSVNYRHYFIRDADSEYGRAVYKDVASWLLDRNSGPMPSLLKYILDASPRMYGYLAGLADIDACTQLSDYYPDPNRFAVVPDCSDQEEVILEALEALLPEIKELAHGSLHERVRLIVNVDRRSVIGVNEVLRAPVNPV